MLAISSRSIRVSGRDRLIDSMGSRLGLVNAKEIIFKRLAVLLAFFSGEKRKLHL